MTIKVSDFFNELLRSEIDFFTGVPDSLLKDLIAYIDENSQKHTVAANEGTAISSAIGYHLATGRIPLVYMQNSGIGNAVNPLTSLADELVYSIPILLVIGWRGEPKKLDEPQHLKQGKITLKLLETLGIPYIIFDDKTDLLQIKEIVQLSKEKSKPTAIVIKKDTFAKYSKKNVINNYTFSREDVIKLIVNNAKKNTIIVSNTGMASRELFEIQRKDKNLDFLTVGGMGHASQIAHSIAREKKNHEVICIDGDGAAIMHLGSLVTIGSNKVKNFKHFLINNGVHGSVGNQKTHALDLDFSSIANLCGYSNVSTCSLLNEVDQEIKKTIDLQVDSFLEIKVNTEYRDNLGRPSATPLENKSSFMASFFDKN